VEIVLLDKKKEDVVVARMMPGQYFGDVELLRGGKSIASVRAAPESNVELLALAHKDFVDLLKESPLTEEALARIVQSRVQENASVDRRNKHPRASD